MSRVSDFAVYGQLITEVTEFVVEHGSSALVLAALGESGDLAKIGLMGNYDSLTRLLIHIEENLEWHFHGTEPSHATFKDTPIKVEAPPPEQAQAVDSAEETRAALLANISANMNTIKGQVEEYVKSGGSVAEFVKLVEPLFDR